MHFKSDLELIELQTCNVSHKNVECHTTAAKPHLALESSRAYHCTYIYLTLFFKIKYCIIVDNCPELEITRPEIEWLLSPSGDLGIRLVWHNLSGPPRSFLVRLLKSSSNWTKLSMIGPQLFSGWYQMILDVFQCSQLFSDVFRLFSDDVFRLLKSSSTWI